MKPTIPALACTLIAGPYQGTGYEYAPFVCIHEAGHGPDMSQTQFSPSKHPVRVIANASVPSAVAYGGTPEIQAERVAQIEEIVRRVNVHDKLVAALRALLDLPIVAAVGPDGVHLNPTDLWCDQLVQVSTAAHAVLENAVTTCTFCGDSDPQIDEVAPGVHAMVCQGCGAIGPHDPNVPQTAEEAIRKWERK